MMSIVVLSSDGYSDCWQPLFLSLKKYFSGIEKFELILSTNSKSYNYPGLEIKTITHGDVSWSKRLKDTLDKAENELVLVIVEDFFLRSKLDADILQTLLDLMNNMDKIDHIRLADYGNKFKTVKTEYDTIDKIAEKTTHRFLYLPGIWKKQVLKKYIVDFESPYMAEKMGNIRSGIFDDGFYCISKQYIKENGNLYHSSSSGAVYKGRWAKWVGNFCKDNSIDLDLSKRGHTDKDYNENVRKKTLMGLVKSPVLTSKSVFNIVKLYLKVKIFNIK